MITEKKFEHRIFQIWIIWRGFEGFIESLFGILVYFLSSKAIIDFVNYFFLQELVEDPKDIVVHFVINSVSKLSLSFKSFIALYLLFNGILKIVLAIALWNKKLWAYFVSEFVIFLIMIYEIRRFLVTYSSLLLGLIIFDIIIIILIWKEYRRMKKSFSLEKLIE